MRSATPSDLSGLCARCHQRAGLCLCALVPTLEVRTDLLILRHAKDASSTSNTARLAALALPRARLVEVGGADRDGGGVREAVAAFLASRPPGSVRLLFPSAGTPSLAPPPAGRPGALIVPDGSWRQARRMIQRIPGLDRLPRLSLAPRLQPARRLRTPPDPQGMSTIEAIAAALAVLEGEALARPLEALYAEMLARSFTVRRRSRAATQAEA